MLSTTLGLHPRSSLARRLGAERDAAGAVCVDAHRRTSVPGLTAAGGVVQGFVRIVVAMGHALAATPIHDCLSAPAGADGQNL